jgi:class 3 adenylate cyclase/tetratricopeptide (TPR) repeat protein
MGGYAGERPPSTVPVTPPSPSVAAGFVAGLTAKVAATSAPPVHRSVDGTLVSADLSGFTRLGERLAVHGRIGPEVVQNLMNRLFDGLVGIATDHGGDVLKFRGDALLILFPDERSVPALAAVATMQEWLGEHGRVETEIGMVRLRMTAGVAAGTFDAYLVGDRQPDLMLAGPAVTTVVRRESEGRPGQVIVGDEVTSTLRGPPTEHGFRLRLPRVPRVPRAVPPVEPPGRSELLPPWLDDLLAAGEPPAEHRLTSIAFLQLTGVNALRRRGSGAVLQRLARLSATVEETMQDFGVTFVESDVAADGITLILAAGMPTVSEHDEERLVRATQSIVASVPQVRAGLHRGTVFVGPVGPAHRRTYAVTGETMNIAARLMSSSRPGQVLATEALLARTGDRFDSAPLPPMMVKGKRQPVLAAVVGGRHRAVRAAGSAPVALVGRDDELALLVGRLDSAAAGRGTAVAIVGEAGIGKSAVLAATLHEAGIRDMAVARGSCEPYETAAPYAPLHNALRELLEIPATASAGQAGRALSVLLDRAAPDLVPLAPLLAIPLGADVEPTAEASRIDPSFVRARLHDALTHLLSVVVTRPLVVAIEDLHWADEATRDLIVHLAGAAGREQWAVFTTSRPPADGPGDVMPLEPLAPTAARALALGVAGTTAIDDLVLGRLREQAGGNPLFLRELVVSVLEHGRIRATDTVEQVLAARVDALAIGDRTRLREAAVLGGRIDPDLLARTTGRPELADERPWRALAGFVEPEGTGYRFHHDLLRVVAYEGLPHARRRELHGRVADTLAAAASDDLAVVARHYTEAHRWPEAWRWGRRAGDRAVARHAAADAADLYRRALDAARVWGGAAPRTVGRASMQLGELCERLGRFDDAHAALTEARRAFDRDPVAVADCLRWHGNVAEKAGRYGPALRWYRRGLRELDGCKETTRVRRARAGLELGYGVVRFFQGRYADSTTWVDRALATLGRLSEPRLQAQAHLQLEMACSELRRPERADHGDHAIALFTELGDDLGLGNVLLNVGFSLSFEGRWSESVEYYVQSHHAFERCGDVIGMAYTLNNGAEILTDQGRNADARELLEEARRVWRAADYRIGVAITTSGLARLDLRDGDVDRGGEGIRRALAEFRELGSESYIADSLVRIVEWSLHTGEPRLIESAITEARDALDHIGDVQLLPIVLHRFESVAAAIEGDIERATETAAEADGMARAYPAEYEVGAALDLRIRLAGSDADPAWSAERDAIAERLAVVTWPPIPL